MIVKILGYKISLEIIILMLVIYLVIIVHALSGCCNLTALSEGFNSKKEFRNPYFKKPEFSTPDFKKKEIIIDDIMKKINMLKTKEKFKVIENIII